MTNKELKVAAQYLTILNMGQNPILSVSGIYREYESLNNAVWAETGETLLEEYQDWLKDLMNTKSYAYDEWNKVRDQVQGLK